MKPHSTSQIVVTLGIASALVGCFLQFVEKAFRIEAGLRWTSVFIATTMAGAIVARRERGVDAILRAGEAGMGVGAVDGVLRAMLTYMTDTPIREMTPCPELVIVMAGTQASMGKLCGGVAGVIVRGIAAFKGYRER